MGRAQKLLDKTKKLENKIRKTFYLQQNKHVEEIEYKPTLETSIVENYSTKEFELEAFTTKALIIERVDYTFPDEKDYGLELQIPPGLITASGIRSGDEVVFCAGTLEGRSLEVIEVLNTTTLRLDDVSTYGERESNIPIRFNIN